MHRVVSLEGALGAPGGRIGAPTTFGVLVLLLRVLGVLVTGGNYIGLLKAVNECLKSFHLVWIQRQEIKAKVDLLHGLEPLYYILER